MKERVERRAAGRCPTSATRASRRRAFADAKTTPDVFVFDWAVSLLAGA